MHLQFTLGTLGSLLHQCSKTKAFQSGLSLHAAVIKTGTQSDVIFSNHVLNMYAKCGNISIARQAFDEMPKRNLVSWSAMISGYDQARMPRMAIHLFSQMKFVPNEYIFASVISSCASLLALIDGQQIHAQAVKLGCESISFVFNSLILMYMKCNCWDEAFSLFNSTDEPDRTSFNAVIAGFVENQRPERGFVIYKLMNQKGLVPDCFSFVGGLGICINMGELRAGMALHCQAIKLKLDSNLLVGNQIIRMYSRSNLLREAEMAFISVEEKDAVSWNTLITACSHYGDHAKVLSILRVMIQDVNVVSDHFTFANAFAACASLVSLHHGKQIHAYLIRGRVDTDVGVSNALVNMYAKCGSLENANCVFSQMDCHNLVSWNSIIAAYGNHGFGEKAIEFFEQMTGTGVNPDSITFLELLAACNHAGFVEKGRYYFNSMQETYGINPDVEHFSCFIDLLGRAGRLQEAEDYFGKFNFRHCPVVLRSLLSACRLQGNVVMGERLAKQLLEHRPATTSPFVLLANMYASGRMWDNAADAIKRLEGSGLKKDPGHSFIEVNGRIQKFTIGRFSHTRAGNGCSYRL